MTDLPRRRPRIRPWAAALAVLAVVVIAGVYVTGGGAVKSNGACLAAIDAARTLARAPLAGIRIADDPRDLSDFAFETAAGAPVRLADFSGRIVLLNLWATWCAPCRAEMPALDRLAAARGGDDFAVVAVNIDSGNPAKPKRFLKEIGAAALADYRDPKMALFGKIKAMGLAFGLPTTLVVDRNGCQIAALNGPAEWDSPAARAFVDAAVAAGR